MGDYDTFELMLVSEGDVTRDSLTFEAMLRLGGCVPMMRALVIVAWVALCERGDVRGCCERTFGATGYRVPGAVLDP